MLLQIEVNQAEQEIDQLHREFSAAEIKNIGNLFSDRMLLIFFPSAKYCRSKKVYENIAGIDIPVLEKVVFQESFLYAFRCSCLVRFCDPRTLKTTDHDSRKKRSSREEKIVLEKNCAKSPSAESF